MSLGSGAVVTGGAIWIMLGARARVGVRPIFGGGESYGLGLVYEPR